MNNRYLLAEVAGCTVVVLGLKTNGLRTARVAFLFALKKKKNGAMNLGVINIAHMIKFI